MSDLPPHLPDKPAGALQGVWRMLLLAFAGLCLVLAVIGVFVPGMPTTVFVLMSAWAAARSSPRFLHWLESHRLFGPMIRDWRDGGYVSRRAKWSAGLLMSFCAVIMFVTATPRLVTWLACSIMVVVLVWLCLRPERTKASAQS